MSTCVPELAAAKRQLSPGGQLGILSPEASARSVLSCFARYPSNATASHLATRSPSLERGAQSRVWAAGKPLQEERPSAWLGLMTELRGSPHGV